MTNGKGVGRHVQERGGTLRVLDVGCGKNKWPGAVGVDHDPTSRADVIHDLNHLPWPFENDAFDLVVCRHIIEHLDDVVGTMKELHRIIRPGGQVAITTPHFTNRCSYVDPTHRHHFSVSVFDAFLVSEERRRSLWQRGTHRIAFHFLEHWGMVPQFNGCGGFRRIKRNLDFGRLYRCCGVQGFANRYPEVYEYYLAFIFPARDIRLELEVVK